MSTPERRVVVVGCPGSGKTTVAGELANLLGVHHVELDALFHGPGWTQRSDEEFQNGITAALDSADDEADGWVICGNYNASSGEIHVARADVIVWLDLPKPVTMRRLIWRTARRGVLRKELWNGNRESLSNFYRWDPDHNIMRWAWLQHPKYREQYTTKMRDGSWDHLSVHRLRSDAEVAALLAQFRSA